jgi:uncharacterized protein YjbI with pentapeptide repeats/beta-lactamase regulating signal transducer with metallopeptidase domain
VIAWQQGFVTFASALAAIALNALWQDALLVLCVWLLLRAWPGINAATRYTVWCATLVAAFVVPVATTLAFFSPPAQAQTISSTPNQASPARWPAAAPAPALKPSAVHESNARAQAAPQTLQRLPERLRLAMPVQVALTIFALWAVLAAYALVRLAIGLARLEQLKRDALPLPVEYRDAMPQWLRANKGARDVRLCVSDETDVPVAVGLFDAMILVPRSLLDRLSQPEVDQICLHELAHLRRADDWTNGLQRVISALLGWNPAAAFVGQQLDLEREVACDDWVLSFVHTVRPYALCLTKMAETSSWPRRPIPAPGVFATRKHISLRIERLLGAGRNMATNLALAPAAAAVGVVGALALAIALVAPSVASPLVIAAAPAPAATATKPVPIVKKSVHVTAPAAPATRPQPQTHPQPQARPLPQAHPQPPAPEPRETAGPLRKPYKVALGRLRLDRGPLEQSITNSVNANVREYVNAAIGASKVAAQNARTCSGCDYHSVDWSGRDMHGVSYVGVDLSGARLAGTNFSGGNFSGVDFSKADLHGASFRSAHLVGCDFTRANLTGADFTGARISGCQFTGASLTSAELRDVLNSCSGCDFAGASLPGLNLANVRASGDDFTGADLRGVNFAGAQLTGIDFTRARLDGANLAGATLNGCDISGVDLTHVNLSHTKLVGMDFSKP